MIDDIQASDNDYHVKGTKYRVVLNGHYKPMFLKDELTTSGSVATKENVYRLYTENKTDLKYENCVKWILQKLRDDYKLIEYDSGVDDSKDGQNYVFIIDEINRGNISKIFGELITLIEENKREGASEKASAILPYSREEFSVPSNVYIIGTMNTADRSIAQIDTALRRRFKFIEMMPNPELLKDKEGKDTTISISQLLQKMNERIEVLLDREHTIGHSYFWSLKDNPTLENLSEIMRYKVLPLLQEYFYDDYDKIRLVLGDDQKVNEETQSQFITKKEYKDLKNLFRNNISESVDTDSLVKYEINEVAFKDANAYKYLQ